MTVVFDKEAVIRTHLGDDGLKIRATELTRGGLRVRLSRQTPTREGGSLWIPEAPTTLLTASQIASDVGSVHQAKAVCEPLAGTQFYDEVMLILSVWIELARK